MAVIKPALIENKATRDAQAIVEQVPGVQINENQVSIRGGSGWSYGAGSRVMVMVDGMPMLAGDANDIKWSAIPLENISQIEILKGASSVLYGSSALNGVINIRTQYPKDKPVTKVNLPESGSAALEAQLLLGDQVHVVSALQNIGSHLVGSEGSIDAEVLVCGNSDDAVDEVIGLIGDLGLNCWHAGSIENSAAAEALTSVLIAINQKHKLKSSGIKITSH